MTENHKPWLLEHRELRKAKLTVKHDIKDQKEFEIFKKHVSRMEEKGKRKEMGAQNMPF